MEDRLRDFSALFDSLAAEVAAETTEARMRSGVEWARIAADLERCLGELGRLVAGMQRDGTGPRSSFT